MRGGAALVPLGQPPEVAPDAGGIQLPANQVHVRAADHPPLVGGQRHPGGAAHGSGCTHSSVLAARLALGDTPLEAARAARRIASEAVAAGLRDIGEGAGPVNVLGLGQ